VSDQSIPERGLTCERVYEGRMVKVRLDEVVLSDGLITTREVVEHPGAVAVLALRDPDTLLMVRQYRYAIGAYSLELPAGCLNLPSEAPLSAAMRELAEETGYEATDWEYLGLCHTSCGFTNEAIHFFVARGLIAGVACPDADERLEIEPMTVEEVLQAIREGRLTDAKTIVGLMWLTTLLEKSRV